MGGRLMRDVIRHTDELRLRVADGRYRQNPKRAGDCYYAALEDARRHDGLVYEIGTVVNPDTKRTIYHAWSRDPKTQDVLEPVAEQWFSNEVFQRVYKARTLVSEKPVDVQIKMVKSRSGVGPALFGLPEKPTGGSLMETNNPATRAVHDLLKKDYRGERPEEINNGNCFGFAATLAGKIGDGARTVSTMGKPGVFPGHWVVEYKGRYYDAESPEGVDDLKDLRYSRRMYAFMNDDDFEDSYEGLLFGKRKSDGPRFQTGRPIRFVYIRNTEPAPYFGSQYGQDIEPAGRYMSMSDSPTDRDMPGWETGTMEFRNPLVIDFGGSYQDPTNWKHVLKTLYGKTGKALSRAILRDGHDGIITIEDGEPSEIVDLTVLKKKRVDGKFG